MLKNDQSLHCFPLIWQFSNTSAGSENVLVWGGWVRQRCRLSQFTEASNWDWFTVEQCLLSLQLRVEEECSYCPPPFRRKVEGHCFWFSVGRGAWCVMCGAWCVVPSFSGYFVSLTPPTVSVRSFWNFTGVLRMVWRYACGFFRILK